MLDFTKIGVLGPVANLGKPARARPATAIQSPSAAGIPRRPTAMGPAPTAPAPSTGSSNFTSAVKPAMPAMPNPATAVQAKQQSNAATLADHSYKPPLGTAGTLDQTGASKPPENMSAAGTGGIEQTPARANIPASNETSTAPMRAGGGSAAGAAK